MASNGKAEQGTFFLLSAGTCPVEHVSVKSGTKGVQLASINGIK